MVDPEGETTTYWVAYDLQSSDWCTSGGASGSPAFTAPVQMANSASQFDSVGGQPTGLTLNVAYCAEVIASNASGETDGGQVVWWQGKPRIENTAVLPTGLSRATFEGDVNPGGQNLEYEVLYGPAESSWCTSGGTSGSPPNATAYTGVGYTDNSFHELSVDLTGLTLGSDYCAEFLVFGDSYLQTYGEQVTWTQSVPDADTYDTYSTGPSTATVEGDVDPASDATTTYQVGYDLADSEWCTSGGTSGSPSNTTSTTSAGLDTTQSTYQFVSVDLSGLAEHSDYCAELIATNSNGEADGGEVTWTQGEPTAETFDAFSTGVSTATIDGDVNPADKSTNYQVWYDLASSEWCTSGGTSGSPANMTAGTEPIPVDNGFHPVSFDLTGLSQSTAYCGEIVAANSDGVNEGGQLTWMQPAPPPTLTVSFSGTGSGTVTSSPAGLDCSRTCAHSFGQGTQVTLTATPAGGSKFGLWLDAPGCTTPGKTTCTITLNQDVSIGVVFSVLPTLATHTLTVSRAGTGSGSVTSSPVGISCDSTCSHAFAAGAQVTLTATPASESRFAGWSGGGCSGLGTCTVTMTTDQTVTATFLPPIGPGPIYKCKVPRVKGKKLAAAKLAIRHAHCKVGRITKAYSTKMKKGRVAHQKPRPATRHPAGTRVRLTVSKGRKPAR